MTLHKVVEQKKKTGFYLNAGDKPPLHCTKSKDGQHEFQFTKKPKGNNSGEWIEKCIHCGITVSWDDSD